MIRSAGHAACLKAEWQLMMFQRIKENSEADRNEAFESRVAKNSERAVNQKESLIAIAAI